MFIHWTLWLPDAHWAPGPLPGLSRGHEPISLLPPLGMCWSAHIPRNRHWRAFPWRPSVGWAVSHQRDEQCNFASCSSVEPKSSLSLSLSACMHTQLFSRVQLFATPWTIIHQAPLSMDFPGKNTGAGCPFLLQGSFRSRDPTLVSCIGRHILYHWATWESSLPPSRSDSLQIYQVFPKATKPLLFSGQSEEDYGRCRVSTARIKSSAEEGVCSQLGAILQVPAASETWGISPLKVKC